LARQGPRAFYEGSLAEAIAADMQRHGGLITRGDLAGYKALEKKPLVARYRSYDILTVPPSSAGGVSLIEMLNMLEPHDLRSLGHNSSAYVHLVSEVMKRAYADRSRWLADPDFVSIPVPALLSREYAASRMAGFDPQRATPVETLGPGDPLALEKPSTTHFSIIDEAGNIVSNTYTLNERFGNGAVVEGLGFLLNDEMDDFSVKPGQPNLFGLIGGEANSIAPGKRMASSMTPTLVLERAESSPATASAPARPVLVLGSPGGAVIISAVLEVLLDIVDFRMELQTAVDAPRFHHQWRPDRIFLDKDGFPSDVIEALRRRGHDVVERAPRAEVQAIFVDRETGWLRGASDARGFGLSSGY
ncbi:MAG TPA: gamma-glutamyltransferase, partial [Patescibacteria group bacterium]|nr:gamma-glutamyltransferase [Patescibacteria group bacterium]